MSSSSVKASKEYEDTMDARPPPVWSTFGEKKRKRETSEEHNVRNGEREKERRGKAHERRVEEEQDGGGAATRERADARGAGERGVLRPTPRSMLSSEVPVGGGCAEFPAVRREGPPCSSRRVPTLLFLFFFFFFFFFCFFFPRLFRHETREREFLASPTERNNGRLFRQSFNRLSTGSSSLPVRSPRERKYGGRSVATGRQHRDVEIHTRTVTYKPLCQMR